MAQGKKQENEANHVSSDVVIDDALERAISAYCDSLMVERNVSPHTLRGYSSDLYDYARWAARREVDALEPTFRELRSYLAELDRAQYSRKTINRRLSSLKGFFRWLMVTGQIDKDASSVLQGPKQPKSLPHVIRPHDMVKLLRVYSDCAPRLARSQEVLVRGGPAVGDRRHPQAWPRQAPPLLPSRRRRLCGLTTSPRTRRASSCRRSPHLRSLATPRLRERSGARGPLRRRAAERLPRPGYSALCPAPRRS